MASLPYRLALDVGTASCGLIAWTLDEEGQPSELAYDSLDIWSEPLLPAKSGGVGQPKKAARRAARLMRRGNCRRARRLRKLAHLSDLLGLEASAITPEKHNSQNIYRLRAQAAEERVELADLLCILLHLAKNRGPSGDWVYAEPGDSDASSGEKKDVVGGVRKLESLMQEAAQSLGKENLTLGQYLNYRREQGESVILGKPEIGLYPSRRMVEQEFDRIWETQANSHQILCGMHKGRPLRDWFFDAIFHQRPLKSPAPMVGRCPLEPTLPRSPAAQMAAQAFRIEKQLSDLRWGMGRHAEHLSSEQKSAIRKLMNVQAEASFSTIRKKLSDAGCPGPTNRGLNMERASRDKLKGNTTFAAFRKCDLESEWNALSEKTQIQVINFLADLGSPDALDNEDWYRNFETTHKDAVTGHCKKREFSPELIAFINLLRMRPKFGRLTAMGFDGGRLSYSIKALKKLAALMEEGWDEREAIDQAYPEYFKAKTISSELPPAPETGSTVVDVALRQVHSAVEGVMKACGGPPTEAIVELSRDMALGLKKRGEIENKINKNKKIRQEAAKAIEEHGAQPTAKKISCYLLWEQQFHYCPYCDRRIGLGEALSGAETNLEHILPRTLTRVGGKRSQLVLAHKKCNNEKGNRTPWQAFNHDEERWAIIEERAKQLRENRQSGKARLLLLKDWDDEVLNDKAIKGFTDRQFHESSWIAKLTAQWLRSVCRDVSVSRGELTAHLRRIWKLDTVIPEVRYAAALPVLDRASKPELISSEDFHKHKTWWEGHGESSGGVPTDRKPEKRVDHRHHLIDALVISLTDRKLFTEMAKNYKREREKERSGQRAKLSLYKEPPVTDLRDLAVKLVTEATIRHKPDRYPDGPMFEQTAYGISREANEEGGHKLAMSKYLRDLAKNGGNAQKTRRVLQTIESNATKATVLKEFDKRIASGVKLKEVFNEPILHPEFKTPIQRVRLLFDNEDTAEVVTHTNRQGVTFEKRYPSAGYAYLDVRVVDDRLVVAPQLVRIREAMRMKGVRPEPGVARFWKGDTVRDKRGGGLFVIRQIKAEGGGALIGTLVTETRPVRDLSAKEGLRKFTGRGVARLEIVG